MAITVESLEKQQAEYKTQYDQLNAGLAKLEADYAQNKELIIGTMNQVSGAIQALDVLIKTLKTEPESPESEDDKAERVQHAIAP
jgi:hypothetical protein